MTKKYDESEGVWRTIGGRRVFIRTGQSLGDAMRESGKFPSYKSKNPKRIKTKDGDVLTKKNDGLDENANIPEYTNYKGDSTLVPDVEKYERVKEDIKGAEGKIQPKNKITEQGNSNRKEVREAIQKHIKEYYEDEDNWEENFIHDMENQKYGYNVNPWQWGKQLAENGTFLIYDEDIDKFMNSLKINPKGKKFNNQKTFETYTNLIGRESARLYEKLKNKK